MPQRKAKRLADLVRRQHIVRAKDLERARIPRNYLTRLVERGQLLEALRDCYRQEKATMDELFAAAKVCRMANVMRPYLESLR